MATHSLRLCHVNSSPSFFPIPLSHKKKRKEKSWTTAENTPCRRMTEQGHKLRGCRSCFLFLSPVIVLSFPSPGSSCPYFSSVQERQLCVVSSRWSPEEREKRKKSSFKRAWADSAGELWHRLSLCICVCLCVRSCVSVKIMLGTAQPSRHTQRGRVRAQGAGPVSYSLLLLQL